MLLVVVVVYAVVVSYFRPVYLSQFGHSGLVGNDHVLPFCLLMVKGFHSFLSSRYYLQHRYALRVAVIQ